MKKRRKIGPEAGPEQKEPGKKKDIALEGELETGLWRT